MTNWPKLMTARMIVERDLFPGSERTLLELAKKYRIGRKMGRVIAFTDEDWEELLEALPVPGGDSSKPRSEQKAPMSADKAYHEALRLAGEQKNRMRNVLSPAERARRQKEKS